MLQKIFIIMAVSLCASGLMANDTLTTGSAELSGRVKALEAKVENLTAALQSMEKQVASLRPKLDARWFCSAKCGSYSYSSLNDYGVKSAEGKTALEAFKAAKDKCSGYLYTRIEKEGRSERLIQATIPEVCVKQL